MLQGFGDYGHCNELTLSVTVKSAAAGFPVVVNATLINTTDEKISWWCGGPDVYPGAEHFTVRVRLNADSDWHDVTPTNGQFVAGSGYTKYLEPGDSIMVPLAIPVNLPDSKSDLNKENGLLGSVAIRVSCIEWKTAEEEVSIVIRSSREIVDSVRRRIIAAIVSGKDPFGTHMASMYSDAQVIDALLKLATIDCGPVASRAASALARQPELPLQWGEELSLAARRWLAMKPDFKLGGIQEHMLAIALKTRSILARDSALELLQNSADPRIKRTIINALRLSPGGAEWLKRARIAIEAVRIGSPDDAELSRQVSLAIDWLDSRLQNINANSKGITIR